MNRKTRRRCAHGRRKAAPRVTREQIRRYAATVAAKTTSHLTRLDPDALAERMWEAVRYCALCREEGRRKPSSMFAVWVPGKESDPVVRVGLADHQMRTIHYGLCAKCCQTIPPAESVVARVEGMIADRYLAEANLRAALDVAGMPHETAALPDGSRMIVPDVWSGEREEEPS